MKKFMVAILFFAISKYLVFAQDSRQNYVWELAFSIFSSV